MKKANEISEELRSMDSILADLPRTMPYAVPVNYFTDLAGTIRTTIDHISETEHVPGWSKTMPFAVPDNYFSELTDEVTTGGIASGLPKATPFSVPSGYFATLPSQMLEAAKAADVISGQTKIIPLKRTNIFRSLRWAAAAVLFLGIGLGAYQKFYNTQQPNVENMLASVPGNDIEDYVQHTYRIDGDRIAGNNNEINNIQLDNKDIIEYLDETGWD